MYAVCLKPRQPLECVGDGTTIIGTGHLPTQICVVSVEGSWGLLSIIRSPIHALGCVIHFVGSPGIIVCHLFTVTEYRIRLHHGGLDQYFLLRFPQRTVNAQPEGERHNTNNHWCGTVSILLWRLLWGIAPHFGCARQATGDRPTLSIYLSLVAVVTGVPSAPELHRRWRPSLCDMGLPLPYYSRSSRF